MKTLNKNQSLRDNILYPFFKSTEYCGGIRHFSGVTYEALVQLFDGEFVDPEETQNNSPSTNEFLSFLKTHQNFTVHGYVVEKERSDYRVSIEGLELKSHPIRNIGLEDTVDFINFSKCADELSASLTHLRSWYD